MGRIQVLPPALVNRIAAGECVERPASVVKELVENSLDAGASKIDILIADGGRSLIQVTDDGEGIEPQDLPLAVHPHATSKIRSDEDLFAVRTLGFRGEALASIASVSRLTITSRRRDSELAYAIRAEAGQVADPTPCAAPCGTVAQVRDLFYNVPARRRFLRTNQTEAGHVADQVVRLALAHPQVAFTLRNPQRVVWSLVADADRRRRIGELFGPELAAVLLPVRREGEGVLVEGYVAPPAESRASGRWEYVFVNGRWVRDRFVSHAIREAYRSLIDPSRFPVAFLFIRIDPEQVDVNVHPTKSEVRWRDSNYIHGQVLAALRDRFLRTSLDHTLQAAPDEQQRRERIRAAMVEFFTRARPEPVGGPQRSAAAAPAGPAVPPGIPAGAADGEPRGGEGAERGWSSARSDAPTVCPPAAPASSPSLAPGEPRVAARVPELRIPRTQGPARAIQLHRSYIVVETPDGLMIIDQHALHERILYEEMRRRLEREALESQRLLIPETVGVPADRIEVLEVHAEMLERLGIELRASGPQSVTLHAFPSLLERVERERFVRDLLDRLAQPGARPDADTLLHELLDMMACRGAVKAGDPLTDEEIEALLARREQAERSSHCPHGRPTTLHLTLRDLERQFHRR